MIRLVSCAAPGNVGQLLGMSALEVRVVELPAVRAGLLKALQQSAPVRGRSKD